MDRSQLEGEVAKIRASSSYRFGDRLGFKIPFVRHEVELPAPMDPYVYAETLKAKFGMKWPQGGKVAIVCPCYGSLCAVALNEGAREVLAIEPRHIFHSGLDLVLTVLDKQHFPEEVNTVRSFKTWPTPENTTSLPKFDLILWPEGMEECVYPKKAIESVLGLLAPGGQLLIEVKHGTSEIIPADRINSWHPTPGTFRQYLASLVDFETPEAPVPGRMEMRIIYGLKAKEAPPEAPTAPKPKKTETKTVVKTKVVEPEKVEEPPKAEPEAPTVILPDEKPEESKEPEEPIVPAD